MFQEILTENGTKFIVAAVVVLLGLLCLALVLWIVRGRPSSPFIRGGRNRLPRLAVLDAAAIDTRRRLVLVRRDDVEHLIMIGGPTDVVIESRIVSTPAESSRGTRLVPKKHDAPFFRSRMSVGPRCRRSSISIARLPGRRSRQPRCFRAHKPASRKFSSS